MVRREEEGIRRYVHLATGNYNPQTARVYTDLGFFTCSPDFCEDASALFNYLTGYCELPQWRKLIVAPSKMQAFMIEKIEQETALQAAGKGGRVIAKINGLLEPAVVQALYRASQGGVRIDVICRGICAASRSAWRQREYPRGFDRRPISGAQQSLLLRQWRRSASLYRLCGLDGPKPEPASGSGLSHRAAGPEATVDR